MSPKRIIIQNPNLGVQTKNSKYEITYLLDIPELLKVVQAWDDDIRSILPRIVYGLLPYRPRLAK
jgi:hypothetical protein